MEPTSNGHKHSASIPKQAAAGAPGYSGWSMPRPTLRPRSCKAMSVNMLTPTNNIFGQRLLVFSSFKPSYRAKGNNICLRSFLLRVRHRLCFHSHMATAVCMPLATWYWIWNQGINNSSICCGEFTCYHQRESGHGMAAMGRLRHPYVSYKMNPGWHCR